MYSIGNMVNNTILHIWKLLREYILIVFITGKNCICVVIDLTRFIMVIIYNIYKYWIIMLYTWN